jgi:hypothetical protein
MVEDNECFFKNKLFCADFENSLMRIILQLKYAAAQGYGVHECDATKA